MSFWRGWLCFKQDYYCFISQSSKPTRDHCLAVYTWGNTIWSICGWFHILFLLGLHSAAVISSAFNTAVFSLQCLPWKSLDYLLSAQKRRRHLSHVYLIILKHHEKYCTTPPSSLFFSNPLQCFQTLYPLYSLEIMGNILELWKCKDSRLSYYMKSTTCMVNIFFKKISIIFLVLLGM